jgi:hypothetical protein
MLSRLTRITFELYTHIICSVMELINGHGHVMERFGHKCSYYLAAAAGWRYSKVASTVDTQHFNRASTHPGIPSQITLIRLRFAASC